MAGGAKRSRRFFSISSSAGVISAVLDLLLRVLIFPIFGIPYSAQTTLYPLIGLPLGFISVFILIFAFNLDSKSFKKSRKFIFYMPIIGAVLMPILRLYLFPLVGIIPLLPSSYDYVLEGFWDMLLTAYLLRFIDFG